MSARLPSTLVSKLLQRARFRCEYCLVPIEFQTASSFEREHITPVSAGGANDFDNLAVSCAVCNRAKSSHMTGQDPDSLLIVPLFNPRMNEWEKHFTISLVSGVKIGLTPTGRATATRLEFSMRFDPKIYFHKDKDLIDVSDLRSDARDPLDQLFFLRAERLRCNFENVISLGLQLVDSEVVLTSPNKLAFQLAAIGQVIESRFTRSQNEHELREGLALVEKWRRYFLTKLGERLSPKLFDDYAANFRRHLNSLRPCRRAIFKWPFGSEYICQSSQAEDLLLRASAVASSAASGNHPDVLRVELPTVKRYLRALCDLRAERPKDFIKCIGNIANIVRVIPDFLLSDDTDFFVAQMHEAALQVNLHYAFDSALVIWLQRHVLHSGIANELSIIVPSMNVLIRTAKRANLHNELRQIKYAGRIYIN
ncbi:MAG: HNH endonuclease [Desulfobacterales bacterium]|nr:HNH endonuclease [Desulfobacterales bacterium]